MKKHRAGVQDHSRQAVMREFRKFLERIRGQVDEAVWQDAVRAAQSGKQVNPLL